MVSRPRFWMYELGTFFLGVVGVIAALQSLVDPVVLVFALYFLVPANILIYGINDIFDYETDKLNPKKVQYETLLTPDKHKAVWWWIALTNIPFVIFAGLFVSWPAGLSLLAFLFFATFYSAKPIRAKTKPILDSFFSAGHYIATGVFGYFLAGGDAFPWFGVLGGIAWAMAMHAYSAVPDIRADKEAGFQTIATLLRRRGTLYLCGALYLTAGILFYFVIGWFALGAALMYLILIVISLRAKTPKQLFKIYTIFPVVNVVIPMAWSIMFMLQRFS